MAKRPRAAQQPVDVMAVRKANLKTLIAQWEGPTNLAKKLGLSGPSYVSQLASGHRPFTEKTARKYESALDLQQGWFDLVNSETGKAPRPVPLDPNLFPKVMALCRTMINEAGVSISMDKFSELVTIVYDAARSSGGNISESYIKQLITLLEK